MYSKSHNSEIMTNNKADEVIKELFESILNRYKIELKTSMRDSDFYLWLCSFVLLITP